MTPECENFFKRFEAARRTLLEQTASLPESQRAFKPAPNSWSILEVLQHLILVEDGMLRQIGRKDVLSRKPVFPLVLGRIIYWAVFTVGIRARAPVKSVLPTETLTLEEIGTRWEEKRTRLKVFLEKTTDLELDVKTFFHPILGAITVKECMKFFETHYDHHMKQIGRIRTSKSFSK